MNSTSSLGLTLSRREFLAAGGALVFGFSLGTVSDLFAQRPQEGAKLPGSLASTPMLDAWIRIGADGTITVCTVGNASATLASFDLGTSLTSSISMTGGTIVTQLASTGATQIDYRDQAGSGFTGVTGNKEKGLDLLRQSAAHGIVTPIESRTALSLFLRHDARYPEAIVVQKELADQYPHEREADGDLHAGKQAR